jgi:nicotinate-nucleotide adenylyltransferase
MNAAAAGPDAALIGLLGGSFDPVHRGHLELARAAQRALGLAQLRFVPAGAPWQKAGVSPAADRLRMLELALPADPAWSIDTRELHRDGPTYTVETLREVRAETGPARPLVWILGFDQLQRLSTWHRWEDLVGLAHLAYARRAGSGAELDPVVQRFVASHRGGVADLHARPAGAVAEFSMPPVDCSASAIRSALAGGDEALAAAFVPERVLDYIRTHRLYTKIHGN